MTATDPHIPPDEATRPIESADRFGFLIRVKPEFRERYVVLHAHPFPGLIDRMREAGLRNYSIFLRDHTLFAYYEYVGEDFAADTDAMAENDTVQDWWTLTDPMQEPLDDRAEGEWWASMDELFHYEDRSVSAASTQRAVFEHVYRGGTMDEVTDAYDEGLGRMAAEFEETDVQTYAVYRLGRGCFTYLEYAGDDLDADLRRLRAQPTMKRLRSTLSPLRHSSDDDASPHMDSVFFMA